jgi:Concanavalin A-like lectin/glucanases superfamily
MKKRPLHRNPRARQVACTVSAAALMLGVSEAATVGINFQANYCGAPSISGYIVTTQAFGIGTNGWQNLTQMDTGYSSCSGPLYYNLSEVVDTTTSAGGLHALPNGSLNINWGGPTANVSGFSGGYPGNTGEFQVYHGFIRDGINFGPPGGPDNNQPGYNVDITGLKSLFTNSPFVIQLIAGSDSMKTFTNALVVDLTHSSTQSVVYAAPFLESPQGGAPWVRGYGGGLSTVTPAALDTDHVQIFSARPAHGGDKTQGTDYNRAGTISGLVITDKPVVTMSPQPVKCAAHDNVNLRAIAAGVPPLSYQWRKDGVPIPNATTAGYAIANISGGGGFDVVVTNAYGSATSKVSQVTVDAIQIAPQPFVLDSKPSGTPINGADLGAAWAASNTDSNGTNRQGVVRFNSAHPDQIVVAGDPSLDSTTGTISFWMRSPGASGSGNEGAMLFDRSTTSGAVIVLRDDGSVYFKAGSAQSIASSTTVIDDQWHNIAITYDQSSGGVVSIYVDGVFSSINLNASAWSWPVGQQIELGHSHDSHWKSYDGVLDDVRIYNRVLTDPEIALINASGALVDTSALKLRLNFDARPVAGVGLSWNTTDAVLQSATAVTGPFTDVSPAVSSSPYYSVAQPSPRFFRYRRTAVSITSNPYDM